MQNYLLENAVLKAEFSSDSGAMVALTSKLTGWQIQKSTGDSLAFRMYAPLEGRRSNIIYGIDQKPLTMEYGETKPGSLPTLLINWTALESNNAGVLDISFSTTITLTEFGLTFTGKVENNSQLTIESIGFPCITALSPPSPDDTLVRVNQMTKNLSSTELYPRFPNMRGYWGTDGPEHGLLFERTPYMMISNGNEGLYIAAHRSGDQPGVEHTFELKPGHRDFYSNYVPSTEQTDGRPVRIENRNTHFPFVQPGEIKKLTPVVFQPYEGDWHSGVDVYKKWRSSWFTRPEIPSWADEVHSWQQIHINSNEGELRCRYSDLVRHAEQCVKHGVGTIQLTGWTMWGQDGYLPDHNIDPRLGTWEDLKEAIATIQAMGVRVVLYQKFQFADLTTEWYRNDLHRLACHDWWGNRGEFEGYSYQSPAQQINATVHREAMMCLSSEEWRTLMHAEFRKCFRLGADGFLNDEIQNFRAWHFCFDKSHGHDYPAFIDSGACTLAEELANIAKAEHMGDEPFLLSGENQSDLLKLTHGLSYFRVPEGHTPVERYIDSDFPFMVSAVGFDDRESINACLLYRYIISYEPFHFRGELDDFPMTIEYGKRVDNLRRRYREFLWDGEFHDILGATVELADGESVTKSLEGSTVRRSKVLYSVFTSRSTGGHAVVVANFRASQIEAHVALESGTNSFAVASPEEPESRPCNGDVTIAARSAVVVMDA